MNTPNANENKNLKKNANLMPYKYETEHTYMDFIFIWAAAKTHPLAIQRLTPHCSIGYLTPAT
jgi:hypothetical protein